MNGKQHMAHAKERLMKWLEYRFRFGFSEWMSTYYEVEVLLLANLYDLPKTRISVPRPAWCWIYLCLT